MKLVALLIAAPAAAATYNPHLDFSNASNPNGVYTYGYEAALGGPLTAFTSGGAANTQPGAWRTPAVNAFLGVYDTGTSILLHPGQSGEYSILRFTVVTAGRYSINGSFSYYGTNTTDVHVLVDDAPVFAGLSDSGHQLTGFGFSQLLTAGQTVDFAVGNGGNGYSGDSTLLSATLAVPEPAAWALMIAGFSLVGVATRRRAVALSA
nr:PEPxxWA-CTERM sorting domain-containing protein [Polymorphobacter sp.]